MDAVEFFDAGFGLYMLPVTPPGGASSPSSTLNAKVMGKAPGRLTAAGWTGVDVNDHRHRCQDYKTAMLWRDEWGSNVGFAVGNGFVVIDNDQGEEFSQVLCKVLADIGVTPLRRYVLHEKHKRDAFFLRVLDFVGDPASVANQDMKFRKDALEAKVQVLAHGKQAVISGMHPGTKAPYVWNRVIASVDDIPVVSDKKLSEIIRKFMEALADDGWSVPAQAPQARSGQNPAANSTSPSSSLVVLDWVAFQPALDEVSDLLKRIPNRDTPPGAVRTSVDIWLDEYPNWVKVAYCVAAQLGSTFAMTPEAERIWLAWSDGRQQTGQSSKDLWRSVLKQPQWQLGSIALLKLVRQIAPENPPFPAIDPNDPQIVAALGPRPLWDKINSEWIFLAQKDGRFVHLPSMREVHHKGFASEHSAQAKALAKELGWKGKRPNAADVFVNQPDKRIATTYTYWPGLPQLIVNMGSGPLVNFTINRWIAPVVQARTVTSTEIKPWLDHLDFILESESGRFVKWCAYVVQHPEDKPNWHFLIMGCPGVGKDTMVVPVKLAIGTRNCLEAEIPQLHGDFNDAYEKKLLIVSETSQPWREAHRLWTRLKQVLAKPPDTLRINPKHLQPYLIPNLGAAILFSNDLNPIFIEPGDRRLHILNQRHIRQKPAAYYDALRNWLDAGGADAVASYLHGYPLSDAEKLGFKGNAPDSPAKQALIQQNLNPALYAFEEMVRDARSGVLSALTTVSEMVEAIELRAGKRFRPTPQEVGAWLLDMEHKGKGAGRLRRDPNNPSYCGAVSSKGQTSARLWHLSEKAPDGRDWSHFSNVELLAMWRGKPPPPRATIIPFPDDEKI